MMIGLNRGWRNDYLNIDHRDCPDRDRYHHHNRLLTPLTGRQ